MLKKIVGKARSLHGAHQERHRPTGFGFALADGIDYLDGARWDELAAESSVFLSRPYLRALETAGPENMKPRYALVFSGKKAVAALYAQSVVITAADVPKPGRHQAAIAGLEKIEARMLVCGNLLSWGFHGIAFAAGEDRGKIWPGIAEAIYRLRRADRLMGKTDLIMIKDVPDEHAKDAETLRRFSYRPLETEPNMVLELLPAWRSYEDYLGSITANYRKAARKIAKDVESAGCRVEQLAGVDSHAEALHALYLQVHNRQRARLVSLAPGFIPTLATTLGNSFRCTAIRRDNQLVGFVTTLRDGDTAVGYYLGFDSMVNAEAPLYFRLLHAVIDDAIKLGCRRLSLGRTALEPKARLGARPAPLRVWLRHRIPAMNLIVGSLLQAVSHEEAPDRNPFR